MEFGRAVDLIEQIQKQVDLHGEDLRLAFYVDEETLMTANDSIVGPVQLDGVEKTSPPRLDLAFDTHNC